MIEIQKPGRLTFLLLAALVSGVLYVRTRDESPDTAPAPGLGMGYYVRDAQLTGSAADGRILYRVSTATAEQRLADNVITMNDVEIDYEPDAKVRWHLEASHGQIPADRDIIRLTGDVVARTRSDEGAGPDAAPLSIKTDYLELEPETYIAKTHRPVAVTRARDTLTARGMRVYLKQDRLQFESEVQGRFLP